MLRLELPIRPKLTRLQFERLNFVVGELIEAANGMTIVPDDW